jgi:hypothetical protein
MRVESMLRDSPLLAEALIVGEGRPYCIALLWPEQEWSAELAAGIDATVRDVNARLSQPERPRRWAVVKGKLSVESGELTANLKLRRRRSGKAELIAALYARMIRTQTRCTSAWCRNEPRVWRHDAYLQATIRGGCCTSRGGDAARTRRSDESPRYIQATSKVATSD